MGMGKESMGVGGGDMQRGSAGVGVGKGKGGKVVGSMGVGNFMH
jgi:hypothetical protein